MAPYKYKQLDESANETRIMILHPGSRRDKVRVSLETICLPIHDNALAPGFEALSYAWGSDAHKANVRVVADRCDGGSPHRVPRKLAPALAYLLLGSRERSQREDIGTIAITQNLAAALPYLRLRDQERRLWIDAVCVNQQDLVERSGQVKLMSTIYGRAQRVIAWIGLEDAYSRKAFEFLTYLGTHVTADWKMSVMSSASPDDRELDNAERPLSVSKLEHDALQSILERPWFKRLWIRQEIKLAQSALLACGQLTMDWTCFGNSIFCLEWKGIDLGSVGVSGHFRNVQQAFEVVRPSSSYQGMGNGQYQARYCECADPRDRVYALSSLLRIDKRHGNEFDPDYTISISQAYEEATYGYIESRRSLTVLEYCDIGNRDSNTGLPSWVPSWNRLVGLPRPFVIRGRASCGTWSFCRRERGQTLSTLICKGVDVGRIHEVLGVHQGHQDRSDFLMDVRRLLLLTQHQLPHTCASSGLLRDELRCTLVAGCFRESEDPPLIQYPTNEAGRAFIEKLLDPEVSDAECLDDTNNDEYSGLAKMFCRNRSIFLTASNHIGIGPRTLLNGDRLCVLLGCPFPLAIRPVQRSGSSAYQVVGACYVDSLRTGEAFLGPLPDQWEMVGAFDKDGSFRHRFRETPTSPLGDDPRWQRILGEDYRERLGITQLSGRERKDIEMNEVLKVRGLEWTDFHLV